MGVLKKLIYIRNFLCAHFIILHDFTISFNKQTHIHILCKQNEWKTIKAEESIREANILVKCKFTISLILLS